MKGVSNFATPLVHLLISHEPLEHFADYSIYHNAYAATHVMFCATLVDREAFVGMGSNISTLHASASHIHTQRANSS